jgi:hypothetical protein
MQQVMLSPNAGNATQSEQSNTGTGGSNATDVEYEEVK